MKARSVIPLLLFGSGFCALIYQTVWLRECRMIFGGSTAASAAVLAIFMAGLGAGSIVLGGKVDDKPRPLQFYAKLEFLIAAAAAVSPLLLWLTRSAYVGLGGGEALGAFGATAVRLMFAALVLGGPTFLMGGTLPAAGRAIETISDLRRRKLALIYAANALGAVVGALLSTFYLLEHFGNRATLWMACGINVLISMAALATSRFLPVIETNQPAETTDAPEANIAIPASVVLFAAWVAGFVFFLMEMVWYRMMAPLLGGTTFSFGLILAVALLGIGLGSSAYACLGERIPATLRGFALTCAAEAFFIAAPFALGDRIALLAVSLRSLGSIGFYGYVLGWSGITAIVVLPAAIVAGVQFPLLIALLGQGRRHVGRHTALAYACNTLGAIMGAIAGGFGLLAAISAPGAWKLCVLMLAVLSLAVWIIYYKLNRHPLTGMAAPAVVTLMAVAMLSATGPTAAWRQSGIGAGRADHSDISSPNARKEWLRAHRRYIALQQDGTESCLGIEIAGGVTFLINGKSDGGAISDASTQVMLGLLGAILHPDASRSLVIGLGTGCTAGWLAAIPSMQRVDVIELEHAVLRVAELCAPVNQSALTNSKVHITIGDAREKLLTTREQYDLVVSEPSNPFRAGIASLYTREYYEAAARRLRSGGLFVQWVQSYEVDASTIRTIYATLTSVFPFVETWQTNNQDLVLVGAQERIRYDADNLRLRIAQPPFKDALANAWHVIDLEGFFAHYVANDSLAREMAGLQGNVRNTDDRNLVEFGFARTIGHQTDFAIPVLRAAAHARQYDRPASLAGDLDWEFVDDQNGQIDVLLGQVNPPTYDFLSPNQNRRHSAETAYLQNDPVRALAAWREQPREAASLTEWIMLAELLGPSGDEKAMNYVGRVGEVSPIDAALLGGIVRAEQGRLDEATTAFESAYLALRTNPWAMPRVLAALVPRCLLHCLPRPDRKTGRATLSSFGKALRSTGCRRGPPQDAWLDRKRARS